MRINTRSKVTVVAGILGIAAVLGSTVTVATSTLAEAARHQAAQVSAMAPQIMPDPAQPQVMPEP
jgi:hypothetical protein